MTIANRGRDLEALQHGLQRWLQSRADEGDTVTVTSMSRPAAGLSSDTLFVDATRSGPLGNRREELVARLPPPGAGLFPRYDLGAQAMLQQQLATTSVPVAAPVVYEPGEAWIGTEFLVMPKVPGRVLATFPAFVATGWLFDAPPGLQRSLHTNFLDVMVGVHRLDWHALGLDGLARGHTPLVKAEVDWWSDYLDWVSDGSPLSELAEGMRWCRANIPSPEPAPSLLWGDVQFANAVFGDDGSIAAVLDWEMASIGPAEMDFGWLLALHSMSIATNGGVDLPGFLDRDAAIDRYSSALGRPLVSLEWFETFALVRSGAIMMRIARLLADQGIDDSWLTRGNPTIARLRHLT